MGKPELLYRRWCFRRRFRPRFSRGGPRHSWEVPVDGQASRCLIGAVNLLAAADPAQAAMPAQTVLTAAMRAESYVDLPKPIPDAVALLEEPDEVAAEAKPLLAAS